MESSVKKKGSNIVSRHIAAALLDLAILLLCNAVLAIPCIIVFVNELVKNTTAASISNFLVSFFTGAFILAMDLVYLVAMPLYKDGQTVGLRFFDLKIVSLDSSAALTKQYLVRFLGLLLITASTFGFALISEIITISLSSDHNSVIGTLSSTKVIEKEKEIKDADTTH